MNFGALIIGDEILSGRRSDKHLSHLIQLLRARGLKLSWARYAGDEPSQLVETLRQTFATGDVVRNVTDSTRAARIDAAVAEALQPFFSGR